MVTGFFVHKLLFVFLLLFSSCARGTFQWEGLNGITNCTDTSCRRLSDYFAVNPSLATGVFYLPLNSVDGFTTIATASSISQKNVSTDYDDLFGDNVAGFCSDSNCTQEAQASYVSVPNEIAQFGVDGQTGFSLSVWIRFKIGSLDNIANSSFLSQSSIFNQYVGGNKGIYANIGNFHNDGEAKIYLFVPANSGSQVDSGVISMDIKHLDDDDDWHHLVITYHVDTNIVSNIEDSSAKGVVYIDGVSHTLGYTFINKFDSSPTPLFIGANNADGFYPFKGDMTDMAFWPRALSEEEIEGIYRFQTGE